MSKRIVTNISIETIANRNHRKRDNHSILEYGWRLSLIDTIMDLYIFDSHDH